MGDRTAEILTSIGNTIRTVRTSRGLTLGQLSKLAELDLSHLSKIERGISGAGLGVYERIARELGMTAADLFGAMEHGSKLRQRPSKRKPVKRGATSARDASGLTKRAATNGRGT